MNIKAIFLDFGGVLVTWIDRVTVLEGMAGTHGGNPKRLHEFLVGSCNYSVKHQNLPLLERADCGLIRAREFHEVICREGEFSASFKEFCVEYNANVRPIPHMVSLAQKLANRLNLVGVTNTDEICSVYKLQDILAPIRFNGIVRSWQVGFRKPDTRIWKTACGIARVFPQEAVFVDDVSDYVDAWRKFGGLGICFDATKQDIRLLVESLRMVNVRID